MSKGCFHDTSLGSDRYLVQIFACPKYFPNYVCFQKLKEMKKSRKLFMQGDFHSGEGAKELSNA